MVTIDIEYEGSLHCAARHAPSGARIATDAPVDNAGRGESFSPTDLVATALGTCIATIMGIWAQRHDVDLTGMRVQVEKHMRADPRRIGRLPVEVHVPVVLDDRQQTSLENAARLCPVRNSLHTDIAAPITFHYPKP